MMSSEQINIEELLKSIYDNKTEIEKAKAEIEIKLNNISELEKKIITDNELLNKQQEELVQNAKIKARDILLEAKDEANQIIKEMNALSSANIKSADTLRNKLNQKIKDTSTLENKSHQTTDLSMTLNTNDIKPKTEVFVKTLGKNGTIVSHVSKSNEVQVQVGIMKMNININNLEKAHFDNNSKVMNQNQIKTSGYTSISKSKTAKSEINVIGLNVEEAVFVVDKFLDDCSLAKLQTLRIVHGKGTGKLKSGIHQFLKTNPHVKSYRMGTYGEGEMGVTVVELK